MIRTFLASVLAASVLMSVSAYAQTDMGGLKSGSFGGGVLGGPFQQNHDAGLRVGPAEVLQFVVEKRRIENWAREAARTDDAAEVVRQALGFDLQDQPDAASGSPQRLLERRNLLPPAGVQLP